MEEGEEAKDSNTSDSDEDVDDDNEIVNNRRVLTRKRRHLQDDMQIYSQVISCISLFEKMLSTITASDLLRSKRFCPNHY